MRRDAKHVIVEDINSTDDAEHIILENDVFIDDDDENKKNDSGCCCFNKTIIKYWLDFLRHYLD
jgi:hypothetical protein